VLAGATNMAQVKQQTAKQLMDAMFQRESHDIEKERNQISRENVENVRQSVLDKIASSEELAEEKRKIDKAVAENRMSVAEGKLELAKFIAEKSKQYAPQPALDKSGDITWIIPGVPPPPGTRPLREGLTEGGEFGKTKFLGDLGARIALAIEEDKPTAAIQELAASYNELHPTHMWKYTPPVEVPWGRDTPSKWERVPKTSKVPEIKSIDFSNVQFPTNPKTGKIVTKEEVVAESQRTGKSVTEILNLIGAKVK